DTDVSVRDGAVDFFSFTARGRALDEAARIAGRPTDGGDGSPEDAALGGQPLERLLLARLLEEERARLSEERSLPRGASALVRGIVETWPTAQSTSPGSPSSDASSKIAAERDSWVARRLDQ